MASSVDAWALLSGDVCGAAELDAHRVSRDGHGGTNPRTRGATRPT